MLRDGDSVRKDTVSHLRSSVAGRFRFAGHCLYSHWASTHLFNISGIESVSDRFELMEGGHTQTPLVRISQRLLFMKNQTRRRPMQGL